MTDQKIWGEDPDARHKRGTRHTVGCLAVTLVVASVPVVGLVVLTTMWRGIFGDSPTCDSAETS